MGCATTLIPTQSSSTTASHKMTSPVRRHQIKSVSRVSGRQSVLISCTFSSPSDLATKPIVSRGVLLDWYSYAQREGLPHSPFTNQVIPLSHLLKLAKEAHVTFRQGDILLIRTGWTAAYHQLTDEEKERLGGHDDRASCGVEATEESIRWHWDQGFAAVASDTVAYEAWPSTKSWGVSMHEVRITSGHPSPTRANANYQIGVFEWLGHANR